jgi:hypothetical protein
VHLRVGEGMLEQQEDVVIAAGITGILVSLCTLLFLYISIFHGDI